MPISPDHLATYHNAAIATAAYQYGVAVRRLSLRVQAGRRDRPELMPLTEYVKTRRTTGRAIQAYIDFSTVLLAGTAGRLLGMEAHLAYPRPHAEMARLERAYLAEAAMCLEPESDRAFSIVAGWLKALHGGDAELTFCEIWRRANRLLRTTPNRDRLDLLVEAIRQRRELTGQEISGLLQT